MSNRPEVSKAMGDKCELALGLFELCFVDSVHQFDLELGEVVLFLRRRKSAVEFFRCGQAFQVVMDTARVDGQRVPEGLHNESHCLPTLSLDSWPNKQRFLSCFLCQFQ